MTPTDRACLAHIVVDSDAWYDHALKTFGEQKAEAMLAEKVERWWAEYTRDSVKPDYKTRLQREATLEAITR